MHQIFYVTGNQYKFEDGSQILKNYGITLVQKKLNIDELQEIDGEKIAKHKARRAYEQLQKPLIVNDTIWMIPALNNFPGAFMKYVNDCFNADDWLRLMSGIGNRQIVMREIIVFTDGKHEKHFYHDIFGTFLAESNGVDGVSLDKVVTMRADGKSIALGRDEHKAFTTEDVVGDTSYDKFGKWFREIKL